MAEGFRLRGMDVTMLYRGELPARAFGPDIGAEILGELIANQVVFESGVNLEGYEAAENGLIVHTAAGEFRADVVIEALGVVPEVSLAQEAGVTIGPLGAIEVDDYLATNFPGVYAVGDCAQTYNIVSGRPAWYPLGDVANRQGRIAGENVSGGNTRRFPGVVGAQCFKVFDLQVASAGLDAEAAARAGFDPVSATIQGASRAGNYPGGQKIILEMVAQKTSGKLLGGRAVGREGVVERINVIATALFAGLTVDQVGYMDLAYAPPFGGAWSPIQIAAQNLEKKMNK